ncbi:MAG TPA: ABC transporter substrate-binding protein [Actinomycetota bacterium]|jgi:ABC-type nitrate/sulfonate/bicarbonate transport system substrate-binding protein|nr:ABC transporter substrate-binding protein [Actinomycetota bacterium]
MRGKNGFKALTLVLAMTLVAVACSDDGGGGGGGDGGNGGGASDEGVIRFTFAPDPVWDYLKDSGIREEMEAESGIRIIEQASWDEFGLYAGGHADIVSIASFEVPLLEEETGRPATVFGKYNIDRSILVVPADSDAQTLEDLKGKKIAVWDAVSSTVVWGVLANELYGLDFRTGGGDFELVLTDLTNTGALAANGEVDGALVLPDFNVPPLLNEEVRVLYDGRTAADIYAEDVVSSPDHEGPMINIFMAPTDWYDEHPDEVAFFLELWDRGIQEWQANQDTIIESYPQHFAVETPEEIAFIKDYMNQHDWFVESIYLDDAWVETESQIFQLLNDAGLSESGESPRFDVVPAPS